MALTLKQIFQQYQIYNDKGALLPLLESQLGNELFHEVNELNKSDVMLSLPPLELEYVKVKTEFGLGYYHSWTASLKGTPIIAEAGTKEIAIKELMKSIGVKLIDDYEKAKGGNLA